jgi:hypothetical protein
MAKLGGYFVTFATFVLLLLTPYTGTDEFH